METTWGDQVGLTSDDCLSLDSRKGSCLGEGFCYSDDLDPILKGGMASGGYQIIVNAH